MVIYTTIIIPDNVHRLVFYLKHNVSEIEFRLRLQVVSAKLDPVLCLRTTGNITSTVPNLVGTT
jgi:hypothetical protein